MGVVNEEGPATGLDGVLKEVAVGFDNTCDLTGVKEERPGRRLVGFRGELIRPGPVIFDDMTWLFDGGGLRKGDAKGFCLPLAPI